jgi:phosphoribosylaminoimidazole carboxylase PurE protein
MVSVVIVMGSDSDGRVMRGAEDVLKDAGVEYEMRVLSAHRSPEALREYVEGLKDRGVRVIIAGAGWAAHLAGFIASHTRLPVVGVPISSSPLKGLDALLATVQMPAGVPVAAVAIDCAQNAAFMALRILSLQDTRLVSYLERVGEGM